MPWTQADADALRAAIVAAKGAKTITFSDQTITFHDLKQMRDLLAEIEGTAALAGDGPPTFRYAVTSKGT
jgi:hypothetical protein